MKGEVVYIDDEPMLCRAFSAILMQRGIAVTTFTDSVAAIAHINSHPTALVICDYRMPRLSGLDVRAQIPDDIPFYLVSGELDVPMREGVKVSGILTKPFRIERLVEIVESHLK